MKPHKHAELIKAWADGAEIQQRNFYYAPRKWSDWLVFNGTWIDEDSTEYRIKPEPKPDFYKSYLVFSTRIYSEGERFPVGGMMKANLQLTFDGETGELKSAEVLQ